MHSPLATTSIWLDPQYDLTWHAWSGLAVIGAVVGEFVGANEGLGFLVNSARSVFDIPLVYVAVFTLTVMALLLYTSVHLLEWRVLAWQRHRRGDFA